MNLLHTINQPGKAKAKKVQPTRKTEGLGKEALKIPKVPINSLSMGTRSRRG